jgi:phosphoribosylanthranilate isomerase
MTEIKICGITRIEDALAAAESGADAVGFIFHEASPRYIEPGRAKRIVTALAGRIATVGVFVNCEAREVERIAGQCGIDLIQLHGDESPGDCQRFPPGRVIKAVFPRTTEGLRAFDRYTVRALLIDARDLSRYGGTGKRADWSLAAALAKRRPLILAGGLNEENICEALTAVAPQAVDINSGCEKAPGVKDHERLRRIVGMIHRAGTPGRRIIFDTSVKGQSGTGGNHG